MHTTPLNSIPMTRHYLGLDTFVIGLCSEKNCFNQREAQARSGWWHRYGISMEFLKSFLLQTSLRGETSGGGAKYRLFSQADFFKYDFWQSTLIHLGSIKYEANVLNHFKIKRTTSHSGIGHEAVQQWFAEHAKRGYIKNEIFILFNFL